MTGKPITSYFIHSLIVTVMIVSPQRFRITSLLTSLGFILPSLPSKTSSMNTLFLLQPKRRIWSTRPPQLAAGLVSVTPLPAHMTIGNLP